MRINQIKKFKKIKIDLLSTAIGTALLTGVLSNANATHYPNTVAVYRHDTQAYSPIYAENTAPAQTNQAQLQNSKMLGVATFADKQSYTQSREDAEKTSEFVYKYLLAEIANQRGAFNLGCPILYDLAKSTRNASLAERAAKASAYSHQADLTLNSAILWGELEPKSIAAQQAVSQILIASGKLDAAKPHLQMLLAQEETRATGFLALNALLTRQANENKSEAQSQTVLNIVSDLAQPYPNLPEAHFAVAYAAFNASDLNRLQSELNTTDKLRPGWEFAALLRAQSMAKEPAEKTLDFYRNFLTQYPKSTNVRKAYAKLLVNQKYFDQARPEITKLAAAFQNNPDEIMMLGLLSIDAKDFIGGDNYLQQALNQGFSEPDQIYFYLAKSAELQKNNTKALSWYSKVVPGSHYLDSKIASAYIMASNGGVDDAIRTLDEINDLDTAQQIQVIQIEANLLNQAKRHQEAFNLLDSALKNMPNTPDLLYDHASAAERLGKYEIMENELNQAIKIKPDFAAAYNALGYSMADRNVTLPKAKALIEKAIALTPDDHYVIDSLGWINYRLGHLDIAEKALRRAYSLQADPEIAAHLGEVLWQQGKRDEANKIWQDALKDNPDNEVLLNVTKKFAL